MSIGPTRAQKLWQLILKYGPLVVQWLIAQGIIKLPPGVTLPPLGTMTKMPAVGSKEQQALDIDVEYDQLAHAHVLHQQLGTVLQDQP